VKRSLTITAS